MNAIKPDMILAKKIYAAVFDFFAVTDNTDSRKREYVLPRQMAMSLCKLYTKLSLSEIGSIMDKDHASVLHAIKTVNNQIETNKSLRSQFIELNTIVSKLVENFRDTEINIDNIDVMLYATNELRFLNGVLQQKYISKINECTWINVPNIIEP